MSLNVISRDDGADYHWGGGLSVWKDKAFIGVKDSSSYTRLDYFLVKGAGQAEPVVLEFNVKHRRHVLFSSFVFYFASGSNFKPLISIRQG